jgi:hypothetical protein
VDLVVAAELSCKIPGAILKVRVGYSVSKTESDVKFQEQDAAQKIY